LVSDLEALVRRLQAAATKLARIEKAPKPKLHKRPSPDALARTVARMATAPPASFLAFFMAHDGWERFWDGYTIAPTAGAARDDITKSVSEELSALGKPQALDPKRVFTRKEEENPRFVYLPNHVVFATNMNGRLALFDRRTRNDDGDMEIALFLSPARVHAGLRSHAGNVHRRFKSFTHFLEEALASTNARIAGRAEPPVRMDEGGVLAERSAMLAALQESVKSVPPPPPKPSGRRWRK
jgi:hypothetical protein